MPYGVANRSGKVPPAEIAAILSRAASGGMDTLDTAIAYGDAESSLGRVGVDGWRVVSKLPPLPASVHSVEAWINDQVAASLRRLGIKALEALLLHRSADLLERDGEQYRLALGRVKASGLALAVGVSIYDPTELDALWSTWRPDIVQVPCNVLDRRLIGTGWLGKLDRNGVRVHVRSAFLQGLLLMTRPEWPRTFSPWKDLLTRWLEWCEQRSTRPLEAALRFVQELPGVERIVVGVESTSQLEEVLAAADSKAPLPPEDLLSDDLRLIDPSRWSRP